MAFCRRPCSAKASGHFSRCHRSQGDVRGDEDEASPVSRRDVESGAADRSTLSRSILAKALAMEDLSAPESPVNRTVNPWRGRRRLVRLSSVANLGKVNRSGMSSPSARRGRSSVPVSRSTRSASEFRSTERWRARFSAWTTSRKGTLAMPNSSSCSVMSACPS